MFEDKNKSDFFIYIGWSHRPPPLPDLRYPVLKIGMDEGTGATTCRHGTSPWRPGDREHEKKGVGGKALPAVARNVPHCITYHFCHFLGTESVAFVSPGRQKTRRSRPGHRTTQ